MTGPVLGVASYSNPCYDGKADHFEFYEVASVVEFPDSQGGTYVEIVRSQKKYDEIKDEIVGEVFFALYGRLGTGIVQHIADFRLKEEAYDLLYKMCVIFSLDSSED